MNRNQKIALGCGGGGCLGLIVVAIAACVVYVLVYRSPRATYRNYNFNANNVRSVNSNANANGNSDLSTNRNDNDNDNSSNSSNSSTSSSSLSEDDKHKLYQAAGTTGDAELIRRVSVKIGLMDEDYTPGANYQAFLSEHFEWATRNTAFIQSINTPEKARAYVNAHFPE